MADRHSELIDFLTEHGLAGYLATLEANKIDLDVLTQLTAEDFKEMGLPLGDRRRLMTAAAGLADWRADATSDPDSDEQLPERRQLTILFCDMVGSTQLSGRLDPEDLGEVMQTYTDRTVLAIRRHGGHVAKIMGDGLLAYFGYPHAHEDDVERALLAALDGVETNSRNPTTIASGERIELQIRVGVHTGLVVVGKLDGIVSLGADAIVGEAPNIAARLQAIAQPNQIVASPQTRRLAGDRFEYEPLAAQALKGVPVPVAPFRVLREIKARTRFEARHGGALTPLVGRETEVEALRDHWTRTKAGVGQSVMLTGAAGIGKSRLTSALLNAIAEEPKYLLKYQCSPHHTGTPLFPVIMRLNRTLDELGSEPPGDRLAALQRMLRRGRRDPGQDKALLAALLAIDSDGTLDPLDMTPRQQMDESLLTLSDQALALSEESPVLMLFEDVHWADPTTLSLIDLMLSQSENARVMLIATFRTERERPPIMVKGATHYPLVRLSAPEVENLVRNAAHPHEIPEKTVAAIAARAEGVPLFIEELTKTVVEKVVAGEADFADAEVLNLLVPETLLDSLSARLDALPNAKKLAQVAAAIGREIPQDLLQKVAGYSTPRFLDALGELVDARLIQALPRKISDRLVFNHALVQDVAYQLMLKKDRRAIHGRIVQVLERDYSVIVGQLPEVVGRHCEAAQLTEKAIRYFIQAGANAIRRSANIEALGHLRRGLRLIRENPDMAETRALRLELEIQSTIGTPLIAVEGYTSRETIRAFERARDISDRTGDVAARFRALFGLWGHRWMAGHLDLSRQLATEMLAIADDDDDPEHVIIAHRCMGSSHWAAGDFAETREHLSKVTRLTEATDTTVLANKYAVCPCVVSQVLGGYGMWFQEERTEGIQSVRAGLNRAYAMNHAYSIALAHSISAGLGWLGDDMAELKEHTAALRSIAEDRRFPYWRAYADTLEGATLARQGNCTEAISRIEASMAFYDRLGVFLHRSMQLVLLSDAELRAGNPDLAERLLDEAVAFGNRTGERQWFSVIEQRRALVGGV